MARIRKNIIKWYEYQMDYGDSSENKETEGSLQNESSVFDDNNQVEEEINLAESGLGDADQELVADILARFADAKQDSVDALFKDMNN